MIREFGDNLGLDKKSCLTDSMLSKLLACRGGQCDICHGWFQVLSKFVYDCTYRAWWMCIDGTINSPESSLCQSYRIFVLKVDFNNESSLLNCQSRHFRWVTICYSLDAMHPSFSPYLWYRINFTHLRFKVI